MLSATRAFSLLQTREDRNGALQSGVDVGMATRVVARLLQRLAEVVVHDVGETRFGLDSGGKGRAPTPGPRLAVPTHRDVDHGGVLRRDVLVTQAKGGEGPWAKILADDVCVPAQIGDQVPRFGPVQIDAEVSLAGVLLGVIEGHRTDVGDTQAGDIPGRGFDLDDIRPEIAEGLGAMGSGENPSEVNDPDSVQRGRHFPMNSALPGPVDRKASRPRRTSSEAHIASFALSCSASAAAVPARAQAFARRFTPP